MHARKILLIAKRDFIASVRTKAFLFGLVIAPILFGGSFIGIGIMRHRPDLRDRRIAVIDRTGGAMGAAAIEEAQQRNRKELIDPATGRQVLPVYRFEVVAPDERDPDEQRLALSDRVRSHDLYAFAEIGAHGISWYSNESGFGDAKRWLSEPFDNGIRRVRLEQLGVHPQNLADVLAPVAFESMKLTSKDARTGQIQTSAKKADVEGVIPLAMSLLLAMIVMLTSAPMLPAIAEDKMQRVFEMMLASATPFELIAGKVIAAIGRSLVSSVFYIAGGVLALNALATLGLVPFQLLPWFLIYVVAEVTVLCAFAAALGAACGSPQDAQSLGIVLAAPVMIPLFLMAPVLQQPNSAFVTVLSFVPPFTPLLMLMRQSTPAGIPAWQPWAGLACIAIGSLAISWMAARVFRVGILLQGKPPRLPELARWAIRG